MKIVGEIRKRIDQMTLKKRIFVANTGMVLFSLLILLAVGSILIDFFKSEFMNFIGQNATLSEYTYEIQTEFRNIASYQGDWNQLSETLSMYQFELYVSDEEHEKIYSNVRHSEMECIEELERMDVTAEKIYLTNMEGVTIVRMKTAIEGEDCYLYAAYYNGLDSFLGMDRGMFEMFIIVFLVVGILTIVGLVFTSQLITVRLTKKILEPVEELTQAAQRINEGNFDEKINYAKEDEFLNVCTTFDEMQMHLKEGIEKNAAYEKARTEMVSGISHDLRTPLTSMKAFIKGILDGVANTPEKKEQYLRISYQKTCDMEVLLQKLFFLSKLETGNMPFFKKKTDLMVWMDHYMSDKKNELEEKGVTVEFSKDDQKHEAKIDGEQMKRVLDNLLENSVKYGQANPLIICVELQRIDKKERITIADNGRGVEEDKLPHIFEQFYRGDESRNSKNEGSGLGLYVCQYIVQQHGGSITAENREGLRIQIQLPAIL